jgi:hypothetical protein
MNKLIISIISLFFVNVLLTWNVHYQGKKFYDDRITNGKVTPKVYDIGMKYIPDISSNIKIIYLIDTISILIPLTIYLINKGVFLRFLSANLYIYTIRLIFLNLTILPKDKSCDDNLFNINNMIFGHCYDKIFSGHFATVFLGSLYLIKYKYINNLFLIAFLNVIYAILIIATRSHYTVDIAVSIFVTYCIFNHFESNRQ